MKHAPNLKYVQILQNLSKHDEIFEARKTLTKCQCQVDYGVSISKVQNLITKGKTISKANYGVLNSPKKMNETL